MLISSNVELDGSFPHRPLRQQLGNATGLSLQATDVAGKRVEILREVLPGVRRLGIMSNIDAPAAALECARYRQRPARLVWQLP